MEKSQSWRRESENLVAKPGLQRREAGGGVVFGGCVSVVVKPGLHRRGVGWGAQVCRVESPLASRP